MQSTAQTLDFQLVNPVNGGGQLADCQSVSALFQYIAYVQSIRFPWAGCPRGADGLFYQHRTVGRNNIALLVAPTLHRWSDQHCTVGHGKNGTFF